MTPSIVTDYAGLRRELEIGLCLSPTLGSAVAAAKAVATRLDESPVPVRLVGLTREGSRVLITIAVTIGSIDAIKTAEPETRAAVALLARIVDDLAVYDPAFVSLPRTASLEAVLAGRAVVADAVVATVHRLVTVG